MSEIERAAIAEHLARKEFSKLHAEQKMYGTSSVSEADMTASAMRINAHSCALRNAVTAYLAAQESTTVAA